MRLLFFIGSFTLLTVLSCTQAVSKNDVLENASIQNVVMQDLSVSEFEKKMKSHPGILLDVRTPGEIEDGYIPGAIFINFMDADFSDKIAKLDKSKPVYVYCRSGSRSVKTMKKLGDQGFTEVYNLQGGFLSWQSAGKKIAK
jgi:rhodanese-related sulfurtransferase